MGTEGDIGPGSGEIDDSDGGVRPALRIRTAETSTARRYGDFGYTVSGTGVTITGYTGPGGAVVIPTAINGVPVTAIGESAFEGNTGITGVTIPDSVTGIGDMAFERCTGLVSITIPDSVTGIGVGVFRSCTGLVSVTLSHNLTVIEDSAFRGCTGLVSVGLAGVIIPDSVTGIRAGAFSRCTGLTDVTIPAGVTDIGNWAFAGSYNITGITIQGPAVIGRSAFSYEDDFHGTGPALVNLRSLTIPRVTVIGEYAFFGSGLTGVTLPAGLTRIYRNAFENNASLTGVILEGRGMEAGIPFDEVWERYLAGSIGVDTSGR
uniref:Cell surface protein n=1 Tax=uncultured bacterium contig00088 TaxID=1181561 RepID=A0A806K2J0_9BACT|nr:cell surface protein [uncultured bacterium contig00088]